MKRNVVASLGNVPVTSAIVASLFPEIKAVNKKIADLESAGELLRLKRGMFVVSPEVSSCKLSTELIANHLYSPSYVSMQTALRYYGLIPEAVYTTQSMTLKHSRSFRNKIGCFDYVQTSHEAFVIGLTMQTSNNACFVMASPEKALCDLIANSSNVVLRYKSDALGYLEDFLRFDMDYLPRLDKSVLEQYTAVGKKPQSIRTILKLLYE